MKVTKNEKGMHIINLIKYHVALFECHVIYYIQISIGGRALHYLLARNSSCYHVSSSGAHL